THPDLADELRSFFADQDRLDRAAAPLRGLARAATWPPVIGPYRVLGEIARGGMAVVLLARHEALGREVALKWALGGRHAGATQLQRFRREAAAAAGLDHPNLVPLYEVGEHDGVPYFAMKRLRCSLADERRRRTFTPAEAAAVVAAAARAVHHAHQRGLLHRDLKPANILLDAAGTPCVADFGLARRHDADRLTGTGAVLGTPAYMSPEQARGDAAAVTVASDVYGLGAVLSELLAGRPPFAGATPMDVLRRVLDDDPPPPPGPRDLRVVALKCLAKDPSRRYASAAELADDLDRFRAGEPVRARPAGVAERLWRGAARRPAVTLLAAAVLAGLGLAGQQWHRAERALDEARRALRRAEEERDRADASFRQAHAAVNDFTVSFSDELARFPGVQGLRQRLLLQARRYFEDFVARREGNASLRRELADTHAAIGQMTGAIGERRAAKAAFETALALYRALHAADPDDPALWPKLAGTVTNVAVHEDRPAADARFEEARRLYAGFLARAPDDPALAAGLALAAGNRGVTLMELGRHSEARPLLEEAIGRTPGLSGGELAGMIDNYGTLLSRTSRRPEALCAYQRAEALRAGVEPRDAAAECALAATRHHLGLELRAAGLTAAADEALARSLAGRRRVADENPLVVRYQTDLAGGLTALALTLTGPDERPRGLELLNEACAIFERVSALDPANPDLRRNAGQAWYDLGVARGALGQRPAEGEAFAKAAAIQRPLFAADPGDPGRRGALGRTLNNLGLNHAARGLLAEAVAVLEEAVVTSSGLPPGPDRRTLLNAHLGLLAMARTRAGDGAGAADAVRRRADLWPDDGHQLFRAGCEAARAAAACPAGRHEQAEGLAMELLGRAVRAGFRDAKALAGADELKGLRGRPGFAALLGD
ncbi:MAG: protein kinase domain-containing protein, partial [Gemmataceae bacterium]